RDNMRLIAVSLNASDWFNDNYKLFDYGFENYSLYTIYNKGQLLKKVKVKDGSKDDLILVSDENLLYPMKKEEVEDIKLNMDINKEVSIPVSTGEKYGSIKTYLDGKIIKNNDL